MNKSERIRRVWHISRSIANRLENTTAGELKEQLAKVPDEVNDLPAASLFALTTACRSIYTLTDQVAGYPPRPKPESKSVHPNPVQRPLDCGMDNLLAWSLGLIAHEAGDEQRKDVGDPIDRGLILRRLLEEKGFVLYYQPKS